MYDTHLALLANQKYEFELDSKELVNADWMESQAYQEQSWTIFLDQEPYVT